MLACWNLPWLGIWSVRGEWGSVRSEWGANVWTRVRGQFPAITYGDPAPWANPAFNLKCCGEKLTHFDPADETFSFRPSVHWNLVYGIFGPLNPPLHRAHVALRRLNGLSENSSQYLSRIYGLNMSSRILWTVYSRKFSFILVFKYWWSWKLKSPKRCLIIFLFKRRKTNCFYETHKMRHLSNTKTYK